MLLYVRQLLESSITIWTFIRLLPRVNSEEKMRSRTGWTTHSPDVLDELMVAGEGFETLLALVWLDLWSSSYPLSSQLHCCLGHQILELNNSQRRSQACGISIEITGDCSVPPVGQRKNWEQLAQCNFKLALNQCKISQSRDKIMFNFSKFVKIGKSVWYLFSVQSPGPAWDWCLASEWCLGPAVLQSESMFCSQRV